MNGFATGLKPPYYAVIFTSKSTDDQEGYAAMAQAMVDLAAEQPGALGVESVKGPDGIGITVSYWADEAALSEWKANARHLIAQKMGKRRWYEHYELRVARVERAYSGPEGRD